jgi:hypothetical protein
MSVLDYQQNSLCPEIFKHNNIRQGVYNFIVNQVKLFFESVEMDDCDEWIEDIYIGSSIATFYYTNTSDLDIKIVIDLEEFRISNPRFDWISDQDFLDKLVDTGRESSFLTAEIPQTQHPIDAYFYSTEELPEEHLIKYDSLYSLKQKDWIKTPKRLNGKNKIIQIAKEKSQLFMENLDIEIAQAKRNSIDLLIFIDYLKTIDKDDLEQVRSEFNELLNNLESSLDDLIDLRSDIKDMRTRTFSKKELSTELEKLMGSLNYSDGNIVFKMLQRYGYMKILSEINEIVEKNKLKFKDIKEISKVLQ